MFNTYIVRRTQIYLDEAQATELSTPDLVIAATALALGAQLATSNPRHFPMFTGLTPPY